MNNNKSFYDHCIEMVNNYNSKLLECDNLNLSKQTINVHNFYGASDIKLNTRKRNRNQISVTNNGFYISQNFYNFISKLNNDLKKDDNNPEYNIKNIIKWIFTGYASKKTYVLLYERFFCKLKYIKENKDGYIIVNGEQNVKFGKLIITILNILEISVDKNKLSKYIENIVDEYKSWYETKNQIKFNILKGNEILNGYNKDKQQYEFKSVLNSSCMNNKFNLLNLYTQNEDKVLMLSLERNEKIIGRCLIWKLDKPDIIYMDRIYTSDNYINNIFKRFAINNELSYRDFDNYKNFTIYHYNKRKKQYVIKYKNEVNYKVKLNTDKIYSFPYMDSFRIMNRNNSTFYTNSKKTLYMNYQIMDYTDGRYDKKIKLFGITIK